MKKILIMLGLLGALFSQVEGAIYTDGLTSQGYDNLQVGIGDNQLTIDTNGDLYTTGGIYATKISTFSNGIEFGDGSQQTTAALSNATSDYFTNNVYMDKGLYVVEISTFIGGTEITGYSKFGTGSTSHSLGSNGDLLISGKIEIDGYAYFDNAIYTVSHIAMNDATYLKFGSGEDTAIGYNTAQTPDSLMLRLSNDSRGLIICSMNDAGFDFSHPQQTNPTLFIHSANQSTSEWISISHNQTDGVIDTGTGYVYIPDGIKFSDGTTLTSASGAGGGGTNVQQLDLGDVFFPSSGAASLNKNYEGSIPNYEIAFDSQTQECAYWQFNIDDRFDNDPICEIKWVTTATSGGVVWAVACATFDATSTSFTVDLTTITFPTWIVNSNTEGMNISTKTLTGLWKDDDFVKFKIYRDVADSGDDMEADARIISIRFYEE